MDPTMNFLTAPTAAPRGGEVPSPGAGTDSNPQGSEFAGVFNGQMLRLERQALASAAPPAATLQVVPLGNKLSVITTDAPLPDLATLADFARAQGLGETAVRTLFGVTSTPTGAGQTLAGTGIDLQLAGGLSGAATPTPTPSWTLSVGTGLPLADGGATNAGSAGPSLLAQLAASVALKDANMPGGLPTASLAQTPAAPMAPTAPIPLTGNEPAWFSALATPAVQANATTPAAPVLAASVSAVNPASAAEQAALAAANIPMAWTAPQGPVAVPMATPAPAAGPTKEKIGATPSPGGEPMAAFVPVALMLNTRLKTEPQANASDADPQADTPQSQTLIDTGSAQSLGLAAAIQAGLTVAANAQKATQDAATMRDLQGQQAVQITALSVSAKASQRSADAAALLPVASAVSIAVQAATAPNAADAGASADAPPASLRLTLIPPDQAITRRLAQASGNNKQISWSALLAGAKVSDVLAGTAPGTGTAAAAALGAPVPAAPQAELAQAMPLTPGNTPPETGPTTAGLSVPTAQTLAAADAEAKTDGSKLPIAANAATTAAAGTLPLAAHGSKTWENVSIEVPQGLDLEALQAEHLANSDAEPSAPPAFGSAAQSGAARQNTAVALKTETASPQAMAEQRAAHYQQLADRVGEAIAQRLIAQIERGQWKMQMRMQPGALGQIDVQLDMHAAGLDASFSADNAMTRELMAQGANRLRDALTQAGTTVASVWVNGDSSRQSGGNSTPGRNNQGPSSASAKKTAEPVAATVAATASNAAADGLNVLA